MALMSVNMYGLTQTLWWPDRFDAKLSSGHDRPIPRLDEVLAATEMRDGESQEAFIVRMNGLVHTSTVNWNRSTYPGALRVPVWENYLLYIAGYIAPQRYLFAYANYFYADYRKNLEQGTGDCSYSASVLRQLLDNEGIPNRFVGLNNIRPGLPPRGHTVVTAEVREGVWHLLDPHNGAVIPHNLEMVQQDTALIRPHIAHVRNHSRPIYGDPIGLATVDVLVLQFGGPTSKVYNFPVHSQVYVAVERISYFAKWAIPVIFALPAALGRSRSVNRTGMGEI